VDRLQKKVTRINDLIAKDLASPGDRVDLEKDLSTREDALEQATKRAELLREDRWHGHAEVEGTPLHGLAEEKPAAITLSSERVESANSCIRKAVLGAISDQREGDDGGAIARWASTIPGGWIVAVNPDSPEGIWLREYLDERAIPYYAFRTAMRGKATAPHIHIGPGSTRL